MIGMEVIHCSTFYKIELIYVFSFLYLEYPNQFPCKVSLYIGVGRFRILGGQRFRILGGPRGGHIPSRHMTS